MDHREDNYKCEYCNKPAKIRCFRCINGIYCSKKCKQLNWHNHKLICIARHDTYLGISHMPLEEEVKTNKELIDFPVNAYALMCMQTHHLNYYRGIGKDGCCDFITHKNLNLEQILYLMRISNYAIDEKHKDNWEKNIGLYFDRKDCIIFLFIYDWKRDHGEHCVKTILTIKTKNDLIIF